MRCCGPLANEDGYFCCTECGKIIQPALDTEHCSYNHLPKYLISRPYSRKSRFFKKCLGLLRCMMNYKIDEKLVAFLEKRKIITPEDLFQQISKYPSPKRRPFDCIMFYWKALGHKQPECDERDIVMLKRDFDNIFFAWSRLGYANPRFPYSFLFRKIVTRFKHKYSNGMIELTRFVRKLRCETRRMRYEKLFKNCAEFDYKSMQHTPIPKNGIPKQTIFREVLHTPMTLSVNDVGGVYKSKEEMDNAVADGTFDVKRTMHLAKNGKFFMLSFKNDTPVSKMQVSNEKDFELSQTQKLCQMLRDQSMLS